MNLDCRDSSEAFQAKLWGLNFLLQDEVIITQKTVKILPVHDIFSSRNLQTFLHLMEEMEGVASLLIFCQKRRKFVKMWQSYLLRGWDMCNVPWRLQLRSCKATLQTDPTGGGVTITGENHLFSFLMKTSPCTVKSLSDHKPWLLQRLGLY